MCRTVGGLSRSFATIKASLTRLCDDKVADSTPHFIRRTFVRGCLRHTSFFKASICCCCAANAARCCLA